MKITKCMFVCQKKFVCLTACGASPNLASSACMKQGTCHADCLPLVHVLFSLSLLYYF